MSTHPENDFHLSENVGQFCVYECEQRNVGGTSECASCYVTCALRNIESSITQGSSHIFFLTYGLYYLHGPLLIY